jgi:hypothetical protein
MDLTKLQEYIKKHYHAEHGAKTEMWSEGNATDVFNDGVDLGVAQTLFDIAAIIEMPVEDLAESDDDY